MLSSSYLVNGFGGKFEPDVDSSIRASAARELLEEACLSTTAVDMVPEGVLLLETLADPEQAILEIWVFTVQIWEGEVAEYVKFSITIFALLLSSSSFSSFSYRARSSESKKNNHVDDIKMGNYT